MLETCQILQLRPSHNLVQELWDIHRMLGPVWVHPRGKCNSNLTPNCIILAF